MPSSRQVPPFRFLLDENVRWELYKSLKQQGVDVKLAVKGSSDQTVQNISKLEKRILVTNDEDALLQSFNRLISKLKNFDSKFVVLYRDKWDIFPLVEEYKI